MNRYKSYPTIDRFQLTETILIQTQQYTIKNPSGIDQPQTSSTAKNLINTAFQPKTLTS